MNSAKIVAVRALVGLTREEFANHVGVSRVVVDRWERGVQRPKDAHEEKIKAVRAMHDGELRVLIDRVQGGDVISIPRGKKSYNWELALVRRLIDRFPKLRVEWGGE
ncbi:MAG: helix-turn-helix domain-containing protein [Brachybacterium sp.]